MASPKSPYIGAFPRRLRSPLMGYPQEVDVVGGPPFVPGVIPEMAALRAGAAEEIPEVADARRVELVVGPRAHALTL